MTQQLEARGLKAGYGSITVVHGIDLTVAAGEIVALLGPNGAGKTSTLLTMAGEIPSHGGTTTWHGSDSRPLPAHRRARLGMALVAENAVFKQLSVRANLRLGRGDVAAAVDLFPELVPMLGRRAGLLSGGEQQMLAMGRAIAGKPSVLLLDEVSMGLAPVVVDRLFDAVRQAADRGAAVLMVEQQARRALAVADRGYFMSNGRITYGGAAHELGDYLAAGSDAYFRSSSSPTQGT